MLDSGTKEEIEKQLRIVAAAGMISRADGTVTQVYESRYDFEKNKKTAENIFSILGHNSISEHDYVVLDLEDVSITIEQLIISYRLTSFTI